MNSFLRSSLLCCLAYGFVAGASDIHAENLLTPPYKAENSSTTEQTFAAITSGPLRGSDDATGAVIANALAPAGESRSAVRNAPPAPVAQVSAAAAISVRPAGVIDVSQAVGLQLSALPQALGFPEDLPLDASFFPSLPGTAKLVPSLDIASAMTLGVQTSLDLAEANAALRAARARGRGALATLLPRVDFRRADGRGSYTSGATQFSTSDRAENSIEIKLPLFFPAGWMELRRQGVLASVAELERDAKKSSAALDNGLAFLAILSAQGRLKLTQEYDKSLRELLEYTRARAAGGLSTQTDSNRVESRIVGVEADLSEARANVLGALSNYMRLTEHLPQVLSFRNPLPPLPAGMTDLQLVELIEENPALMAVRRRIDSHHEEARAGGSNFLPRLDFLASRQRNDNVGSAAGSQLETKAMLVATFTLFSGGGDLAQIAEANAKVDEQTIRSRQLERQLRADVETTLAGLNTLGTRYEATSKQVKLDTGVITSFMDQLKLGNRPLLDVLDAQQRLYQSRQQLLAVAVTQTQAFLRLSLLTGRLAGSPETAGN